MPNINNAPTFFSLTGQPINTVEVSQRLTEFFCPFVKKSRSISSSPFIYTPSRGIVTAGPSTAPLIVVDAVSVEEVMFVRSRDPVLQLFQLIAVVFPHTIFYSPRSNLKTFVDFLCVKE